MEGGTSLLSCTSLISSSSFTMKPQFLELRHPSLPSPAYSSSSRLHRKSTSLLPKLSSTRNSNSELLLPRSSLLTPVLAVVEEVVEKSSDSVSPTKDMLPKIDKTGRFCSPRAARELALIVAYAACLEGSDPVRLFEKRMNMRREPSYEFDQASLLKYNNMSFGGPPVTAETQEEADKLLQEDEMESAVEAEVLSAPPKLVYSRLILRFTRKLLVAMGEQWDTHVVAINKIIPPNWKSQPAGRILELCILHMAMSDISVLETRHQIVINEAVDLAKRFCDGAAPRIINGCLRTFVKDLEDERARSRRTSSQVPKETTPANE